MKATGDNRQPSLGSAALNNHHYFSRSAMFSLAASLKASFPRAAAPVFSSSASASTSALLPLLIRSVHYDATGRRADLSLPSMENSPTTLWVCLACPPSCRSMCRRVLTGALVLFLTPALPLHSPFSCPSCPISMAPSRSGSGSHPSAARLRTSTFLHRSMRLASGERTRGGSPTLSLRRRMPCARRLRVWV